MQYVPALDADLAGSIGMNRVSIGLANHLGSFLMHNGLRVWSLILLDTCRSF